MAQSSIAIKRENNYDHDFPSKRPADPSDHIPTKEVKRELSPVPLPPTVQVCPINVIQGDSILVKLTYKEGPGREYNVLIDGGHGKYLPIIEKCMEKYRIMKEDDIQLHCIVVTHPDADHMNGIKELLKKHDQKIHNCDIVLTGAFYRDKKYEEFTTLIDHATREDIDDKRHALTHGLDFHFRKEKGCVLRYTPKDDKLKATPTQELPTLLKPKDGDTSVSKNDDNNETSQPKDNDTNETKDADANETSKPKDDNTNDTSKPKDDGTNETKDSDSNATSKPKDDNTNDTSKPKDDGTNETKDFDANETSKPKDDGTDETKDADANATSILTVINESKRKCDVVLTGDSNAKEILPLVEGKEIRIFQVPHHGSSSNYSGLEDSIKHEEITKLYDGLAIQDKGVKEIAIFYSTFQAQCYLISAGGDDKYNHPHSQVLQGIILANTLQHQECVILLTNSRGLILQKIKPLHQVHMPGTQEQTWSEYVKIYHYNDVFETLSDAVSLHPESCISDVCTGALEWTPEAYIQKISTILSQCDPKMSDTRPKDCFIEKSPVKITLQPEGAPIFSAHVICVPVPHSPRSGNSINYCYVIEESIAPGMLFSKALFLLNDDKTTLPRAKNYILFQYTNNEWESKALGATVQDCTCQISACDISFDDINESFRRSGDKDRLVKFLVKGCGCQTPCNTNHCICRKNKCPCAPYCECSNCKNNKVYPASEPSSSNESNQPAQPSQHSQPESSQSQQTKQPSQPIEPPSQPREPIEQCRQPKQPSQLKKQDQPKQKFCRCQGGCVDNKCGCKRCKTHCGPRCKCGDNCKNNKQKQ